MDVTRVSLRAVYEGDLLVLQANTSERVFSLGDRTFQTAKALETASDRPTAAPLARTQQPNASSARLFELENEQLLDVPVEALPDMYVITLLHEMSEDHSGFLCCTGSFRTCDPSRSMTSMNLSVNEDAGHSVHERLLLHWVNSLPLTKCLLVEGLRDLRFGDVLHEIVRWLQHNSADADDRASEDDVFDNDEVVERLRRVVQFAARECRSQDEDAMYVVNDSRCLVQVMSGESDAICAVLAVLKRLSGQRLQSCASDKDSRRRHAQEKIIELSLQRTDSSDKLPKENVEPKQKSKRVQTSSSRSRTIPKRPKDVHKVGTREQGRKATKQVIKKPTTGVKRQLGKVSTTATRTSSTVDKKKIPHQTNVANEYNGLRVCGMLDPTVKSRPGDHFSDDARAVRFCNWARLVLLVEMPLKQIFAKQSGKLNPPSQIRQVFANGVLIRRIAGAIVQRCGGILNHSILNTEELSNEDFAAVNTPAGRRRNFSLALAIFKSLGISQEALIPFESLQCRENQDSHKTIWCSFDEVLNRVEQLERAVTTSKPKTTVVVVPETLPVNGKHEENIAESDTTQRNHGAERITVSPKNLHSLQVRRTKTAIMEPEHTGCALLKRSLPYITSEQMHVVNEWLVRVGLDAKKDSGRGVLQDSMRNGILLCALLTQKLKSAPFSYFKTPRTLTEMRENISKAFERLGEHVPPCYLTSSAEQSVLIGDRQIAYGILWHLWQASHALERAKQSAESSSVVGIHETRRAEAAELGGKLSARVQPSPLQLDIPAIFLAGQGKLAIKDDNVTTYQVKLHDSFARRLAWSENDLTGDDDDDDDVFPVPTAPFSSPVYSDDVDIIPTKTHVMHQIGDDLLPTCSWRIDSVDSSSDSIGSSSFNQNIPSRVAIGELSAAVVTPIADCTDSVEIAEQNRGGDLGVSSTTIKPPAQTQPNAMLSPERVDEVLVWLKRLSLHLKNPSAFHDSNAKLTEFQSGVLLCCIIEKVELMRSIAGITRPTGKQPLSKASALHNITKALNILQQKKTMPLHLLRRATAIYAGNRDVILQLLLQIRKAYGHHLRTPRRPKQHLSSAA